VTAVGVLGGTFDPAHAGHIAVARQCREQLDLDRILLVPSFQPPHRPPPEAGPQDRLAMTRLAAAGTAGLEVDDLEVCREGVSYAVDTLRELRRRDPDGEVVLLLGRDAALEFGTWHQPGEIARLAHLAVFNRANTPPLAAEGFKAAGLPASTTLLEVDSPPVSATEIRRRLAAGGPLEGMLAPSVLGYIRERGLYGART
jgi:nicotinate-nucleotide adenylyltransferase